MLNLVLSLNLNMWTKAPEFDGIIQEVWLNQVQEVPMYRVIKKLKCLKPKWKILNKKRYFDVENATVLAFKNCRVLRRKSMKIQHMIIVYSREGC